MRWLGRIARWVSGLHSGQLVLLSLALFLLLGWFGRRWLEDSRAPWIATSACTSAVAIMDSVHASRVELRADTTPMKPQVPDSAYYTRRAWLESPAGRASTDSVRMAAEFFMSLYTDSGIRAFERTLRASTEQGLADQERRAREARAICSRARRAPLWTLLLAGILFGLWWVWFGARRPRRPGSA